MLSSDETKKRAREYMARRRAAGRCMYCPGTADRAGKCPACRVRIKKRPPPTERQT